MRIDILKIEPLFNSIPNPDGESTLEMHVGGGLLHFDAKLAHATILPPSSLQSIRRPNSILDD
jgi:hypothetical protein